MNKGSDERENRVLALMPTGRDGELVKFALNGVGVECEVCNDAQGLLKEIGSGAGSVLVAEEAIDDEIIHSIVLTLTAQPVWSDLPLIVFSSSSRNAELLLENLGGRINVTIVERPIRRTMLISAVRGALRARQRQYQTRDLLEQLEQADRQKDLFLATLSHELRTPLNSILGWIQIMRTRELDTAGTKHALEVIERNAHGQSEMISDILFVSRIITGKLEIKLEPVDVSDVVTSAVESIRPSAEAKSISLEVDTTGYDPAPLEGDVERLQQVLLNLLTNATKFTPENGTIRVTLKRSGSDVTISVQDNGQGINPNFLPYVFERFRQADSTYTRRIGGLGLGLAIVRHLVELHGGEVTAMSEGRDRGATFTVTLPVANAKRIATTPVPPAEQGQPFGDASRKLAGLSVLLVEDDHDSREMLTMALQICGVNVVSVESVKDALAMLQDMRPDFLISDIGLPGEDGYDLIRKVRANVKNGDKLPAIALTGYVSVQDRNLALEAGYHDHVPKPVDTMRLIELLCKLATQESKAVGKENGQAN